ncbi:MAG: Holliday junction resolvase [Thermoproteota archaeon]|nr:Holliday junction resolvase [Thermoplasmata archaeon]RLG39841.1 MAG: Holliday junction resolvase [Candidatus Korarchaeota archaeon]
MAPSGAGYSYEREFKGILQATPSVLARAIRGLSALEREQYLKIKGKPFMVVRAAGSFGVDLIAIRGDISFPVEVKSSTRKVLHFGGTKNERQAENLLESCKRANISPVYAYRLKGVRGDSWRVFTLKMSGLRGRAATLNRTLPGLKQSEKGNYIMAWLEGMPLAEFIDFLCTDL